MRFRPDAWHIEADRFQFRSKQGCLLCGELDQRRTYPRPFGIVAISRNRLLQRRDHGGKLPAAQHLSHDIQFYLLLI